MSKPPYIYVVITFAIAVGAFCGLGLFTFGYGDGLSYMSNDPAACTNCHVMQPQYDSWLQSSHKIVAVCNDCHLAPHPIKKWVTKADNGFFHSLAFTLGNFHEPIQIKPRNHRVTLQTCIGCHGAVVHQMLGEGNEPAEMNCIRCHSDVGHALR